MTHNFIILHTGSGGAYARRIARSIEWINVNKLLNSDFRTFVWAVGSREMRDIPRNFSPENTIIHARAAHPDAVWMKTLQEIEGRGFRVINHTGVLQLTSDKGRCAMELQEYFPHPRTWILDKNRPEEYQEIFSNTLDDIEYFILKPETSMSQGVHVIKFAVHDVDSRGDIDNLVQRIPSQKVILQEFVPYTAIYRVIVIDGRALPYSFIDRPTEDRWKVSVCLNRTSMEFVSNPPEELLRLAEEIQINIEGKINFIDLFSIYEGDMQRESYVISEINTACNLRIHELLARNAGRTDWNIHYKIAKYLVNSR